MCALIRTHNFLDIFANNIIFPVMKEILSLLEIRSVCRHLCTNISRYFRVYKIIKQILHVLQLNNKIDNIIHYWTASFIITIILLLWLCKSGCPCAIFFYNIVDLNTLCVVCGDSPLHDKISTYTRHAYRMAHALIIHYTQIILWRLH